MGRRKFVFISAAIVIIAAISIYILIPKNTAERNIEKESVKPEAVTEILGDDKLSVEEKARKLVAQMNDREKIGQLVMYTPINESGFSSKMLKDYAVGSVLMNRQIKSVEVNAEFTNQLQQIASESRLGIPLFITGDMEYGAAQRVPEESTALPRQMAIGATRNVEYAEQAARITAIEAKAMGFHWSYSPVADVNSNLNNPVIGVRSFGENTKLVTDMTVAEVKAYQSEGIISSAKHFPGHGDTNIDTHSALAKVSYSADELRQVHLPPFQAAIDQGIESIMTSHIIVEAIDPELPATLSKKVLTGLLREEMGFKGMIVTDAMVMDAISNNWGAGEAAVMAFNAGADIVMANGSSSDQIDTLDSLYEALQAGKIEKSRVDESVERILTYKIKMNLFDHRKVDVENAIKIVGNEEHRNIAKQIALDSVTLVKNEDVLPFDPKSGEKTLVVSVAYADSIGNAVREITQASGSVKALQVAPALSEKLDVDAKGIEEALAAAKNVDRIIVFTHADRELPQGQIDLVNALVATGKPVVAVSLGNPGDILGYTDVKAYLSIYALDNWYWLTPVPVSWEAAVKVIFGANPKGKLPVTINELYPEGYGLSYLDSVK